MSIVPGRKPSKKQKATRAAKKAAKTAAKAKAVQKAPKAATTVWAGKRSGKAVKAAAIAVVGFVTLRALRKRRGGSDDAAPEGADSSYRTAETPASSQQIGAPKAAGPSPTPGQEAKFEAPAPQDRVTPPHGDKAASSEGPVGPDGGPAASSEPDTPAQAPRQT